MRHFDPLSAENVSCSCGVNALSNAFQAAERER